MWRSRHLHGIIKINIRLPNDFLRVKIMYSNKHKITFLTLGCRVNQYESDAISQLLSNKDIETVAFGEPADICVINTCSVTAESDRKSKQMIRRATKIYHGKPVIVCGCSAQNQNNRISEIPGVTLVCGNSGKSELPDLMCGLREGNYPDYHMRQIDDEPYDNLTLTVPKRVRSYIKIEDGCENKCAYCIIPALRGKIRSRTKESVISEATELIKAGAQEIVLTGIETASYGKDFQNGYSLSDLLADIDALDGFKRLTLGSLEPNVMTDSFLSKLSGLSSVLPHFHLSMQSGSSATLRRMRRRYNADQAREYISNIRHYFPDAMLSADVIVGFPGETDADFLETVEFFKENRFLHLHIFPFSRRKGTEADLMPDQIPEDVKRRRAAYLADIQRDIKIKMLDDYCLEHKNKRVRILFEQYKNGVMLGHTDHNVDVFMSSDTDVSGLIADAYTVSRVGEELEIRLA